MTVVAGLVEPFSNTAVLLADSRVTDSYDGHFDICQKVALLGNDGLFGFAGPVKEAAVTAHWITGTYKERGVRWLGVESEIIGMLRHIGALGQVKPNSFLVAYMDERARATLVRFSTDGDYAVTRLGLEMIGSGSEAYEEINSERIKLMEFGGLGEGGIAVAHRALFMSQMIFDVARDLSITSVGGLMQVHFVEKGGARAIPYERWVDIDENYGTYVRMDIDTNGGWVQIHEPSGLNVPLRFPGEQEFGAVTGNFEVQDKLTLSSPGVLPKPNPVAVYRLSTDDEGGWLVRTSG